MSKVLSPEALAVEAIQQCAEAGKQDIFHGPPGRHHACTGCIKNVIERERARCIAAAKAGRCGEATRLDVEFCDFGACCMVCMAVKEIVDVIQGGA